jgi:hypothetical protein
VIRYYDSSIHRPTAAQARAARAAGVRAWFGYLGTVSADRLGLADVWSQADFDAVREGGLVPGAFCSGWDDPAALKALAAAWGIPWLFLDNEIDIRGDGPWCDPWLAASGAGLYGLCSVHGHRAPAHIVALYPGGDPQQIWDPTCSRPAGLLGWQSEGTHTDPATGLSVDAGWLDDGFLEVPMIDPTVFSSVAESVLSTDAKVPDPAGTGNALPPHWQWAYSYLNTVAILAKLGQVLGEEDSVHQAVNTLTTQAQSLGATLQAVQAAVAALKDQMAAGGDPGAAAAISRIEAALRGA